VTPRFSCSEYSFPALALEDRLAIVRLLGFEFVDLGLFVTSPEEIAELTGDPAGTTARLGAALEASGLTAVDLFLILGGDDFAAGAANARSLADREARRRTFLAALQCATDLGVEGLTVLPGMPWAEDPNGGWRCAVDELSWRVERVAEQGVELRIEPHLASIVSTPELVAALGQEVPGLRLTLDASHFVCQSITIDRILPLAPLAGHIHVRSAKPGGIQVHWRRNETDFAALVGALRQAGYGGYLCVEYVPMEKWRCDELDVISEILATRKALAALLEGQDLTPSSVSESRNVTA
jgi:sugar phosphate isomerase/epimerase